MQRTATTVVAVLILFGWQRGLAQEPPRPAPTQSSRTVVAPYRSPYQGIEDAAAAMKPGEADSVRRAAEELFKFPQMYPMPDVMAAVVKQRLIDAQMAYLAGKSPGVADGAVVEAINALATAFDTPDYARVSLLQVRFFRTRLATGMPIFMRSTPGAKSDEANPPMSPLQGIYVMTSLMDQKFANPDYQAEPADWDREYYPRLVEQARAIDDLRKRIAAGDAKPAIKYELRVGGGKPDFQIMVRQKIARMSVAEGLKMFNETFGRLGIK
jgi:hypothetical protein